MGNETKSSKAGTTVLTFLRRARRRYLLRDLLVAALVSAAANFAGGYLVDGLNRVLSLELPVVAVGLPLFLVLVAAGAARHRIGSVAARADERLGLRDRLTTFLDFSASRAVDQGFRRAQAEETSAALARVSLRRDLPIRRFLWAGPPAFAWMLYVSYLAGFTPLDHRVPPPSGRRAGERRAADGGEAGRQEPEGGPSGREGRPEDGAGQRGGSPPEAPPPQRSAAGDAPDDTARPEETPSGGGRAAPPAGGSGGSRAVFPEPATLYSEPVGRKLTPVADAGPAPRELASPAGEQPLRGRISFNLVPADGGAGGPDGPGDGAGRAGSLEITVDYDAVPPQYREQVRRYFETLARLFAGGKLGA